MTKTEFIQALLDDNVKGFNRLTQLYPATWNGGDWGDGVTRRIPRSFRYG